ncbi:MAG: DUF523 domain-containing protein [Vampirovibrionia bacterium]
MKVAISGCLGYFNCRYDAGGFDDYDLEKAKAFIKNFYNVDNVEFYPVCPEQLGGLSTPRRPAEIIDGDGFGVWSDNKQILNIDGINVTDNFKKGAQEVLKLTKINNIEVFILKENSPSCGVNMIYTGEFNGNKKKGSGATSALLINEGFKVFSDLCVQSDSP